MDYRPIYRPTLVLGTSNTTQRMVWNTRNYSCNMTPTSQNANFYGFLTASTSTESASRRLYKAHTFPEIYSSSSQELHDKPEPVLNQDNKKEEEDRNGESVERTEEKAMGKTDSSTQPAKPAYFSWLPRIFKRRKSAVNNANEQPTSSEPKQVLSPETKPIPQNVPTNINGESVPAEKLSKSTPIKMISRMVSISDASTSMKPQPPNPQSPYSEPFTNGTNNGDATESGNEKISVRKNSRVFPTSVSGLKTANFQSTLGGLSIRAQSSIYPKRPQSLSIPSGMEECPGSVGIIHTSEKEEVNRHDESRVVKCSQCDELPLLNGSVEVIQPVVVSAVKCANVENRVEPIAIAPMHLCTSDDDSPYSSDIDKLPIGKRENSKTSLSAGKPLNGFFQPTMCKKNAPALSPGPVISADNVPNERGTSQGSLTSCDGTVGRAQELNQSNSSVLCQNDSDPTSKKILPKDLLDRTHSFNTIQNCDHAKDRLESASKPGFKDNRLSVTSENLEWFSLGDKRTQKSKNSKYGTADSACFPYARSPGSLTSERGYISGLNCSPPAVSIKRKRDLLLLDGNQHRQLFSQSADSTFTPELNEADNRKVSTAHNEVDSTEPQNQEECQNKCLNEYLPLEKTGVEPIAVNGVNTEVPLISTVLKRPDFEGTHLRTDNEGEWTRSNRTRLEGVQMLVAKYEQSAGFNSHVESPSKLGVTTSPSDCHMSKELHCTSSKHSVPCILRADRVANKEKLSDGANGNQRIETEQLICLKSPPAVDRRRKRDFFTSANNNEESSLVSESTESNSSLVTRPSSQETLEELQVLDSSRQMKDLEGKANKEMTQTTSGLVLSEPPQAPRVFQPVRMSLSQTRARINDNDKRKISTTLLPLVTGEKNGPRAIPTASQPGVTPKMDSPRAAVDFMSPKPYCKHSSETDILHSKKLTRSSMVSKRPNLSQILHKEETIQKFTPEPQTHRNIDPANHFTILEQLGKGKFGRVNRCKKKDTDQVLAMKVIRMAKLRRDEGGDVMEVAILRAIGFHESIASLYCAYEYRNECYIFSEYVSGGALYERIVAEDNLDEKICVSIIRQLLLGLQHIQRCSVLHLDLKPENVMMVAPTGYRLKIIDFGLACFHNPSKPSRSVGGTFTYSAPETINYEFQDFSTDTWSIAVIAYEVLSGITPFEIPQTGDPERELSMAEITTNIISCRYHFNDPGICDATEMAKDFIRSILKRNPSERPTVESCLRHEWIMTSEDLPTVKRTVSLRRRNTARERGRTIGSECSQTTFGVDDVWRT
uniref:Zinc transporter 5 n=1 Tax=Schistocephalus solidus TaxID=70667 RepID=A0A0V0JAD3_SCHSO